MGMIKYQKAKVQAHEHVFVRVGDRMQCACGATRPVAESGK